MRPTEVREARPRPLCPSQGTSPLLRQTSFKIPLISLVVFWAFLSPYFSVSVSLNLLSLWLPHLAHPRRPPFSPRESSNHTLALDPSGPALLPASPDWPSPLPLNHTPSGSAPPLVGPSDGSFGPSSLMGETDAKTRTVPHTRLQSRSVAEPTAPDPSDGASGSLELLVPSPLGSPGQLLLCPLPQPHLAQPSVFSISSSSISHGLN